MTRSHPPSRAKAVAVAAGTRDRLRAAVVGGLAASAALAVVLLSGPAPAQDSADKAKTAGETATAVFAGGCFWCTEADFDEVPGVLETVSGFAGGRTENPTYREVTGGDTGHREAVKITYDPGKVSFGTLLDYYWRTVDPTDPNGQFCDRGDSYTTAIFTGSPEEMELAQKSREQVAARLGTRIATTVEAITPDGFYPAEDYHQNYHETNAAKYRFYRWNCGRDARLQALWGDAAGKLPQEQPGS